MLLINCPIDTLNSSVLHAKYTQVALKSEFNNKHYNLEINFKHMQIAYKISFGW